MFIPYIERAWNPSRLIDGGNMALWLDASDSNSIVDVAGAVSEWKDKSGNGNNVTQGTEALQPTIIDNEIKFVNADSLQKLLQNNMLPADGKHSIFIVHNIIDPTASSGTFFNIVENNSDTTSPERNRPTFFYAKGTDNLYHSYNNSGGAKIVASTDAGYGIVNGEISATTNSFYLNGVLKNATGITLETTTTPVAFKIGDLSNQDIEICFKEIIYINSDMSESERQLMEGYLAHKHKLVDNLPVNHPYKTQKPII